MTSDPTMVCYIFVLQDTSKTTAPFVSRYRVEFPTNAVPTAAQLAGKRRFTLITTNGERVSHIFPRDAVVAYTEAVIAEHARELIQKKVKCLLTQAKKLSGIKRLGVHDCAATDIPPVVLD